VNSKSGSIDTRQVGYGAWTFTLHLDVIPVVSQFSLYWGVAAMSSPDSDRDKRRF